LLSSSHRLRRASEEALHASPRAANRRLALLGEEGQGVVHMMRNLEIERLTLAAISLGIADRCLDIIAAEPERRARTWAVARALQDYAVVVPLCAGQRGHPIGFGANFFAGLTSLDGDEGARRIDHQHRLDHGRNRA
jgi:hypothetical protein